MLLCEEPEVYLHPHLRRKLRDVFGRLAQRGWLVMAATHAPEFVSFQQSQQVARLWRDDAGTTRGQILTATLPEAAKFQARLDERGNHELLLANRIVITEGKDDVFAIGIFLQKCGTDVDGRGVTILDVGGCSTQPVYARIGKSLGIPWCALTDEDLLPDGTVKPPTADARRQLADERSAADLIPTWQGSLEACLGKTTGKAAPDWVAETLGPLRVDEIRQLYPDFARTADQIRTWIEQ
jgi:predicted ATP-dependent endonuclease of OLD family